MRELIYIRPNSSDLTAAIEESKSSASWQMNQASDILICLKLIQSKLSRKQFKTYMTKCDEYGISPIHRLMRLFANLSINNHVDVTYASTAHNIILWVIQFQIPMNRMPFSLSLLGRYIAEPVMSIMISKRQLKELIALGYNPKVETFGSASFHKSMTDKYRRLYTKFDDNFWITLSDSSCNKKCHQDSKFCNPKQGFRISKTDIIGKGGFGTVYKAACMEYQLL